MASVQPELRAVGVDVGATRVRAALIRRAPDGCLELEALAQRTYPDSGFVPLSLSLQGEGAAPAPGELDEARQRCRCVAEAVREVDPLGRFPVAVAAPGRKTPDGRGIALSRLGPRIPEFSAWLEVRLGLREPLPPLGSDGILAAVGEERAREGGLRDVQRGYYLAAGTGLAEAFKAGDWGPVLPPLYELTGREGLPFEDLVAARVWPNPLLLQDLLDLLRARLAQVHFQRVVLGGHFPSAVDAAQVQAQLGVPVVASRLPHPAVFGAAAVVLK